jgi:THO complex subunit 2
VPPSHREREYFVLLANKSYLSISQSVTEGIQAGDFMHVYNTVLVLKEILEVFPVATVNEVVGSRIDFEITKLINSEERGDLKILARA